MKMYVISDPSAFKRENQANWHRNTEFWLHAKLAHVRDIEPILAPIIVRERQRTGEEYSVVDVGCGNAWILDLMRRSGISGRYLGLEFNEEFILYLRSSIRDPEAE